MAYVVIAEFRTRPGCAAAFIERMSRHAQASREEAGCRMFDVCQDAGDPDSVLLYEIYDNETAYIAHRATPHYAKFRDWAPPLVIAASNGELMQSRRVLTLVSR